MVYYIIITTQTRICVPDGVKTMRTAGYYFFYVIAVKYLNIGHGLHLEQKFVAGTLGRVAGAAFLGTQYSETDTYMMQYFTYITGYFLCPLVKTTCTANPEQYFRLNAVGGHLGHSGYFEVYHKS